MEERFSIALLTEAADLINNLDEKARTKIYFNIRKAQFIIDNGLLKKLNENIWEFRTSYQGLAYRIFAFWDKIENQDTLVLATHGIIKKSNKTPPKKIDKAENIRKQYLVQKKKK